MKKTVIFLAILSGISQLQGMNVNLEYQMPRPSVDSVIKREIYFLRRSINEINSVSVDLSNPINDNTEKLERIGRFQAHLNSLNLKIAQLPETDKGQFSATTTTLQNLINSNRTEISKTLGDLNN